MLFPVSAQCRCWFWIFFFPISMDLNWFRVIGRCRKYVKKSKLNRFTEIDIDIECEWKRWKRKIKLNFNTYEKVKCRHSRLYVNQYPILPYELFSHAANIGMNLSSTSLPRNQEPTTIEKAQNEMQIAITVSRCGCGRGCSNTNTIIDRMLITTHNFLKKKMRKRENERKRKISQVISDGCVCLSIFSMVYNIFFFFSHSFTILTYRCTVQCLIWKKSAFYVKCCLHYSWVKILQKCR